MKRTQNAIYLPPVLPDYLKNVHDLKPIAGSPSDDEVKGIQAVIRAAQNAAQIPGMFNPELSMGLAQHLFEVQMARYRDKYPCGMFPDDMLHTPPTLPSHVTFALEPIVGVPSDEELQAAQAAVRGYEQMAIFPSMFDPTISMELSQHLFNIQLARYMHNAPRAELGSERQFGGKKTSMSGSAHSGPQTRQPLDTASELSDEETIEALNEPGAGNPPVADQMDSPPQTEPVTGAGSLRALVAESNNRLTKLADTMVDVKQGTRSFYFSDGYYQTANLETMNDEGRFPTAQGLPLLTRSSYGAQQASQLSDENLARYLQFYDLGAELIHPEDPPGIREGKRGDAEKCLTEFTNNRIRLR